MIVVAVRNFESKKLLGFFWAVDHDELWWTIDAIGEPSAYEWTKLRSGGLFYEEGNERDMTDLLMSDSEGDEDPEEEEPPYLNGLELHEETWGDLNKPAKWKRFDYATEGHGGIASLKREIDEMKGV
jgi:hypothetical protein